MKRLTVTLIFVVSVAALLAAQSLIARIDGDQLHITAPRLHFLAGDALSRLRDGTTVKYVLQLSAKSDRNGRELARSQEQFGISYDLWEEKFAVTKLGSSRSISHLTAAAAEAWCVDNTTLPVASLTSNQSFWVRLDYRAEDAATTPDPQDNSGFRLGTLVDIFSRRPRSNEQLHGSEEVGPLRLENLRKR